MLRQIWLLISTICSITVMSQDMASTALDRSRLSIMVLPHNPYKSDVLEKIEKEPGYKEAISSINSALVNMGYTNTLDQRTLMENITDWAGTTSDKVRSEKMNIFIQNAPADILIEAEIFWTDPPGDPKDRQVRLSLKAVDKYNSNIYADNASIRSAQREFPSLQAAVDHVLKFEGQAEFKKFLTQLDSSYSKIIREGRPVNMKFEIALGSRLRLSDRIGFDRISDKIEACVRRNAFEGKYQLRGEGDYYMELSVRVPVADKNGASISPSLYMRKKLDDYLFEQGLQADFSIVGSWINFMLVKKE